MKSTKRPLVMALALSISAMGLACSEDTGNGGSGGRGGSTGGSGGSTGGRGGSGGSGGSTGGTTGGSGGSTGGTGGSTGGTGGLTGGTGGSTGGTGGSTGGTGGSTGGTGGSTGGTGGSTGGTGGSTDGGADRMGDGGGAGDTGSSASGPLKLTVEGFTMDGDRNCYPDGSNDRGNISPKMSWGPTPAGTASWVVLTEDLTDPSTHMIICNIPPAVVGLPRDIKMMVPMGASFGIKHANKRSVGWYGPGAGGAPRRYRISIWGLATAQLEGGCGNAQADSARMRLYAQRENKQVVLANDSVEFWGNAQGRCR